MTMFEHFAQEIKREYASIRLSFLNEQEKRYRDTQPYKGLKILHNVPLTTATIIKLNTLQVGGADITVTSPSFMTPDSFLLRAAVDAGMTWIPSPKNVDTQFDIHLDCAAELLDLPPPRIGAVELTGTGTHKYRAANPDYPCISIDLSSVKALEASLGTGEAFVRAFQQITGEMLVGQNAVVFGYGKVGLGIAQRLRDIQCDVAVVERDQACLQKARKDGFNAISSDDVPTVEHAIRNSFVVVTATGKANCIGDKYAKDCFSRCWLANMGAEDEFGDRFSEFEVLCEKRPINFEVDEPTRIEYLDPVFYAHNQAVELLLQDRFGAGVHAYPQNISDCIVAQWKSIHDME